MNEALDSRDVMRFSLYYRAASPLSPPWQVVAGTNVTAAPNQGFNKLAWLFPYVMGAAGATAIGLVAWRWSRPSPEPVSAAPAQPAAGEDAAGGRFLVL